MNSPPTWSAERCGVAADALRDSGRLRLQVHGESMLPTIWPGAVIEIVSCSVEDVKTGEIVLAMRDGRLFLHRFLGRERDGFLLRGDSMPGRDPLFRDEALLGKMVNRCLAPGWGVLPIRIVCRWFGLALCYCGPLCRGLLHLNHLWEKWREMSVSDADRAVGLEA